MLPFAYASSSDKSFAMHDLQEYLLSYGAAGDFGRFRPLRPLALRRGDRAVVRSHRGLEIGQVLRPAAPGHASFLPNTSVGQLLRPAGAEDEQTAERLYGRGRLLFERARGLLAELDLHLELLDVEMLLDGEHAVLQHVRWTACDVRPFVSTLAREFDLHVLLVDLTRPPSPAADEEHGCGSCGSGGCGSCGSGGCGSCHSAAAPEATYFAGLRAAMERRTSLL
jgi:hypothetical protein